MSVQIIEFDGVALPLYDPSQDHTPTPTESSMIDSLGGAVDYFGSRQRLGRKQQISITGTYLGETTYLVDGAGNRMVDEAGNYLIAGNGPTMLMSQIRALDEKQGTVGQLWRQRFSNGAREWKRARLLQVSLPQKVSDRTFMTTVECTFETLHNAWRAEDATVKNGSAANGVPLALLIANGGQIVVRDPVLTITRTSGTITQVDITLMAAETVALRWVGSLGSGQSLVLDAGAGTVRRAGADAYAGLSRQVGHTARGWLPIPKGQSVLLVTVTGGAASVSLSHYNQFL